MTQSEIQPAIHKILANLKGLDPLKQLFWTELNYKHENKPLSRGGWSDIAKNALAEDPILICVWW